MSTPDRDNYSPTETPANPYHVRELTVAEFAALLRSNFADVSILLQRPMFGSAMFPTDMDMAMPICFEQRGSGHFEASAGLARPQYALAFASDSPVESLPTSIYIDTGRLDTLSEHMARLSSDNGAAAAQRDRLAIELAAAHAELGVVRDDAQRLCAARESAEKAGLALQNELHLLRTASEDRLNDLQDRLAASEARLADTETRLAATGTLLEATLMSHSWRVTAPIRALAGTLRRRR